MPPLLKHKPRNYMKQWIVWTLLVVALVLAPGCKKDETIGEKIDNAAETTKDGVKKAVEKTGDAAKDVGDKIKDAVK